MKIRMFLTLLCAMVLAGCTALQNPSKRDTGAALTNFANPKDNKALYEFSSSPLDKPSVLDELPYPTAQLVQDETLLQTPTEEEAEDFTAENISSAYGTYGDVVVTVALHKFKLGEKATRSEMTMFQQALDAGYATAMRQYRPIGFTYAMSSVGTVNPLSDVEVTCKLSERSANQVGQATCNLFFDTIARRYMQLAKTNKAQGTK